MVIKTLGDLVSDLVPGAESEEVKAMRSVRRLFDDVLRGEYSKWNSWREIHSIVSEKLGGRMPHAEWHLAMTPIERFMWEELRYLGLPFRPQFPVGRFFADFADPDRKLIIECDGKDFHADKVKDKARDMVLASSGWLVFRIPGDMCMRLADDPCVKNSPADISLEELHERGDFYRWMSCSAQGFAFAISYVFYGRHESPDENEESQMRKDAKRALKSFLSEACCNG